MLKKLIDRFFACARIKAELNRYKCVIFANCYRMTPETREKVRALTAGKTRVWLYAQGYCDAKTLSVDALSETVGMKLKRSDGGKQLTGQGILEGVSADIPKDSLKPFFVLDCDAEILGTLENGEIGAARCGDDFWLCTPRLTRELIEPMIKQSGAHIWCDSGDPVMACNSYAAINTATGGERVVNFPDGRKVVPMLKQFDTVIEKA